MYDKSRVLYGLNWAKKAVVGRGPGRGVRGLHRRDRAAAGRDRARRWPPAGPPWQRATSGCSPTSPGGSCWPTTPTPPVRPRPSASTSGSAASRSTSGWRPCRRATDPADLAQRDPDALAGAVAEAQPYLGFRLDRLFGRADLATPEGRARAAAEAMAMVAEHPNELVRDQYLMQVADRCRVEPDRLRQLAPAEPGVGLGRWQPVARAAGSAAARPARRPAPDPTEGRSA